MIPETIVAKAGYSAVGLLSLGFIAQTVALDQSGMPTVATIVFGFAALCSVAALAMLVKLFVQSIETRRLPGAVADIAGALAAHTGRFDNYVRDQDRQWLGAARAVEANNERVAAVLAAHQTRVEEQLAEFQRQLLGEFPAKKRGR